MVWCETDKEYIYLTHTHSLLNNKKFVKNEKTPSKISQQIL